MTAERKYFTKSCFSAPCTLFMEQWVFSLFQTNPHGTVKWDMVSYGQDITSEILNGFQRLQIFHYSVHLFRFGVQRLHRTTNRIMEDFINMNVRNEIKAQIIRAGMTMQEVVDLLSDEYGWSDSVSNLSAKLQRESIRYKEVLELAAVLGYDIVWQKRRET